MKDPGDEDAQNVQDVQDDKTLLDELFGDAPDAANAVAVVADADSDADSDADVAVDAAADADVAAGHLAAGHRDDPPAREAPVDSVVLAEPGLPGPRPAPWLMWARQGVRPATAPGCREIGLTTTGFVIFMIVDSIMMYTPFRTHNSAGLLPQAITLALLAFGLGALMIWSIRGACRPIGVGMMLGWVFMTLISAGYFTGLNP